MITTSSFQYGQRVRVVALSGNKAYGRVTGIVETPGGYRFHVLLDTGERGAFVAEELCAVQQKRPRKVKQ